jgi:hypothetical protein
LTARSALVAWSAAGCDWGVPHDERPGTGVQIVQQNVGPGHPPLPADGHIELAFDQYLLPSSITRQTFSLRDANMNAVAPPGVSYDPVARIVSIVPPAPLLADQSYNLVVAGPRTPNPLFAVDGATLPVTVTIGFFVTAGGASPRVQPRVINFCDEIMPIFSDRCAKPSCHGGAPPGPAEGLRLDTPQEILETAVGRVAHGASTGPIAGALPPGRVFGVDMPIIDPGNGANSGGNPANSWLLYKLLLAQPRRPDPGGAITRSCTGAILPAQDVADTFLLEWSPAPEAERTRLAGAVPGSAMPYPTGAGGADSASDSLTDEELERVSRWIAQAPPDGGLVPPSCCVH